jgi:tetratricopeptide (TPR) repeat protein
MKRVIVASSFVLFGLAPCARAADPVTFTRDIAPILFEHCAACHRPGDIGPFSLLTYRDARQHLTQIAQATAARIMPPWKPDAGPHPFVGDRSLSSDEIALIQTWAAEGGVEGDPADLPPVPPRPNRWQLGTPDVVAEMPEAFTLRAEGPDVFRTFVLRIPTDRPRYVKAIEFRPGNARAVHHANIGVDHTSSSRRLDEADAEIGYEGGMVPDAGYPAGYMLGWTPGQRPRPSPDGMPWRLEPGSDLVVQLHMQPTGKPETVQASAAFYFTDEPPARTPVGLRLGSETIEIAPGDPAYEISDRYVLPVDVELLAIQPHAHNLGRRMEANATRPDGTVVPLITIRDWDFRWQDVYRYQTPIALPAGTTLSMRFVYDNSAGNPRNPVQPPQHVVWGQNTTDEMGDLWLQVVPTAAADLGRLVDDIGRKTRAEDIAAYTKVMRADPLNPLRHDAVALLHLQAGRPSVAVAEFRESLRLNPQSAPTHYNLGLAFSVLRQYEPAMREFEAAVRLDPAYAAAHNNLGAMQHLVGQLDAAAASYRRAFTIDPENADAHNNLGRLLTQEGQYGAAVVQFEAALRLTPDAARTLAGLAWIRASAPDPALRDAPEAVRLAERAATLAGTGDPTVLDTLAVAQASAGSFDRAIATAEDALAGADKLGMQALAGAIRARLQLFMQHQPYLSK